MYLLYCNMRKYLRQLKDCIIYNNGIFKETVFQAQNLVVPWFRGPKGDSMSQHNLYTTHREPHMQSVLSVMVTVNAGVCVKINNGVSSYHNG